MTAPIALTIAGSDSGGGAGIQADLKTFAALEVYGATVITALTAQNSREVTASLPIPPDFVQAQLRAVLSDFNVRGIKTGMLATAEIVQGVARELSGAEAFLVVDPVMVSKSGARLLAPDAVNALRDYLLPLAEVVTPNLPEAAELLRADEDEVRRDPDAACRALFKFGCRHVVLKGGHFNGPTSNDLFFDGSAIEELPAARIATRNTHGTGCTFSAAIAALLARGMATSTAVREAKSYIAAAIAAADSLNVAPAEGHGPVHHFVRK